MEAYQDGIVKLKTHEKVSDTELLMKSFKERLVHLKVEVMADGSKIGGLTDPHAIQEKAHFKSVF